MEIRDINYFRTVAEHGNIGRAAEALNISPTALSKSLRRLESSVGAKLTKRTAKGVDLTAAGMALIDRAQKLQVTMDDIRREAADIGSGLAGHIRAGFPVGVCEYCVLDAFAALRRESPQISLGATTLLGKQLTPYVMSGQGDFVVRTMTDTLPDELACEELFRDKRLVIASARHPLVRRKRVTLADLSKEQWTSQDESITWVDTCQLFGARGLPLPKQKLVASSSEMRLAMVENSNLVMCYSSTVSRKARERYGIVELPVEGFDMERGIGVCYRKDGYLSPAARRMIEILKEQGRKITAKQRVR